MAIAYLQHGRGTSGPFRTESVRLENNRAYFEGRWRRVHTNGADSWIVFQRAKIYLTTEPV